MTGLQKFMVTYLFTFCPRISFDPIKCSFMEPNLLLLMLTHISFSLLASLAFRHYYSTVICHSNYMYSSIWKQKYEIFFSPQPSVYFLSCRL